MAAEERDRAQVTAQIGRGVRASVSVLERCSLSLPVVIEVPPVLDTGEPFPTTYWLTCPLLCRRIGEIESVGGVQEMEQRLADNASLAARMLDAHERYARHRTKRLDREVRHRPSGGVAGSRGGIKCLHAHAADFLAGNDNPIGQEVMSRVGPAECPRPCIQPLEERWGRNPAWRRGVR